MGDESSRCQSLLCSPAALIDAAAGEIVRRFSGHLPDLSALTILLPNGYSAAGFKQALRCLAACDVLLLPRFATLSTFAKAVPVGRTVASSSLRLAQLYSVLKTR